MSGRPSENCAIWVVILRRKTTNRNIHLMLVSELYYACMRYFTKEMSIQLLICWICHHQKASFRWLSYTSRWQFDINTVRFHSFTLINNLIVKSRYNYNKLVITLSVPYIYVPSLYIFIFNWIMFYKYFVKIMIILLK